jgi:transcriptional regulator with XRE-family HTH domain
LVFSIWFLAYYLIEINGLIIIAFTNITSSVILIEREVEEFVFDLRTARKQKGLTQEKAASYLGVTQAYLSMLENKHRAVPEHQLLRVAEVYGLPSSELPLRGPQNWRQLDNREVASELAALGYAGFSYMHGSRPKWNPAELLLAALTKDELESRVAEGLPWLVYAFNNDMNWDWLVREAKANDVTNRLGFAVTLARKVAERREDPAASEALRGIELRLFPSVLLREDTFCHEQITSAERRWLKDNRTAEAQHWNVLSDLSSERLSHATA